MTLPIQALIFVAVILVLLLLGEWIAIALGAAGLVSLFLFDGTFGFLSIGDIGFNTINDFTLTAVPLFIFMGEVVLGSGLSQRFYQGISVWVNRLPGGLLHTNILASGIFSAISGSSVATAATIGGVAVPEMTKRRYNNRILFGSLAAGGTLGILIPPSLAMILYGSFVSESVSDLFIAGILPGILMMIVFMGYVMVRTIFQPTLVPGGGDRFSWKERFGGLLGILPMALLIAIVLFGIYLGVMTPTEAAAVGAILALVLAVTLGRLRWREFFSAIRRTVQTTCMLLLIIVGAQVVSFGLVNNGINRTISESVTNLGVTPGTLFIFIVILYLILGMFVDSISMMLLTLPVLYPVTQQIGFDPIWFGIVLVILIEIGQITPPVGLNLFVIQGIAGEGSLKDVVLGSLPFVMLMLAVIAMLWFWPSIALWLPQQGA